MMWQVAMLAFCGVLVGLWYYQHRYFTGDEFLDLKQDLYRLVAEHNAISHYAQALRTEGRFAVGKSDSGAYAHLATSVDTSRFNYTRDRHVARWSDPTVHDCSLQVVRKAAQDPIAYFIKYFLKASTEEKLAEVEAIGQSFARLEAAQQNLLAREESLKEQINPPWVIRVFFARRLLQELGVQLEPIPIAYQQYSFHYVSAGGNSSQRTDVVLDPETIDALIETLSTRIRFRKSAAGQRALMTRALRRQIKERDGFRCRRCRLSLRDEPHLLLEVDHIVPVSKGGRTTWNNLQTLCWKCNREKGNKIE